MFDKAMDKLRDEMAKNATHEGIAMIGEYMTQRLQDDQTLAGQVLAKGKSLSGAFNAVLEYAKKNKTGNFAFVPPAKAYELVDGYWGIATAPDACPLGAASATPKREQAAGSLCHKPSARGERSPSPSRRALDLDALMGGLGK